MAVTALSAGQIADYLRATETLSTAATRKLMNSLGFGGEALCLLLLAFTEEQSVAIGSLVLSSAFCGFAVAGESFSKVSQIPSQG